MTAEIESLQKLILATMNEDAGVSYGRIPLSLSEEIATLISELKKGGLYLPVQKEGRAYPKGSRDTLPGSLQPL